MTWPFLENVKDKYENTGNLKYSWNEIFQVLKNRTHASWQICAIMQPEPIWWDTAPRLQPIPAHAFFKGLWTLSFLTQLLWFQTLRKLKLMMRRTFPHINLPSFDSKQKQITDFFIFKIQTLNFYLHRPMSLEGVPVTALRQSATKCFVTLISRNGISGYCCASYSTDPCNRKVWPRWIDNMSLLMSKQGKATD